MGSAKEDLSAFPGPVKLRAGPERFMVQVGREPDDWKPMKSIGAGACEIRVRDDTGTFRLIYVAKFKSAVYVLHAFQKKSRKTAKTDVKLARTRYRDARELDEKE